MTSSQFEPDHTVLEIKDWNESEIYQYEEYLEFDSGDLVRNTKEAVIEYLTEKYEFTQGLIEDYLVVRKLGEE